MDGCNDRARSKSDNAVASHVSSVVAFVNNCKKPKQFLVIDSIFISTYVASSAFPGDCLCSFAILRILLHNSRGLLKRKHSEVRTFEICS
jgi:hypothetical protein